MCACTYAYVLVVIDIYVLLTFLQAEMGNVKETEADHNDHIQHECIHELQAGEILVTNLTI